MRMAWPPLLPARVVVLLGFAMGFATWAAGWQPPSRPSAASATIVVPLSETAAEARVPVLVELSEEPAAIDWAQALDPSLPKALALDNARVAVRGKLALLEQRQA